MTTPAADPHPPQKLPALAKAAMQLQVFLLRRNWMGAMGEEIMVITTTGRKSGQTFSTPISYLRDGATLIGVSRGSGSNWMKNALHAGQVRLNLRGQDLTARVEPITDEAERRRLFELYLRDRRKNFVRLFGVPAEATPAELQQGLATRRFVRFTPTP